MAKMYFILVVVLFWSCNKKTLFQEGSFENVFSNNLVSDQGVLLALTNRQCNACDMLNKEIESNSLLKEYLSEKYSCYDFPVDVVGNEFLTQLLYEFRFPILAFFSQEGDLRAVWGGVCSAEELLKLANVLEKGICFQTNLVNYLGISNDEYCQLISSTLKAYLCLQQGEFLAAEKHLKHSFKYGSYFYNLYLSAKTKTLKGDSIVAYQYAHEALFYNQKLDSILYGRLKEELYFITGKKQVNNDTKNNLVFDNTTYNCGQIKHHSSFKFSFRYKNVGITPVIIADIQKSCNCMEVVWDKKPILPNEVSNITVQYDTSRKGVFSKILFVCLNGKQQPIPLFLKGIVV